MKILFPMSYAEHPLLGSIDAADVSKTILAR